MVPAGAGTPYRVGCRRPVGGNENVCAESEIQLFRDLKRVNLRLLSPVYVIFYCITDMFCRIIMEVIKKLSITVHLARAGRMPAVAAAA